MRIYYEYQSSNKFITIKVFTEDRLEALKIIQKRLKKSGCNSNITIYDIHKKREVL